MDEDWVKKLLTIVIGSIVLFTVLICQTEQIEKNLVRETSGQKKEEQMVQKKKKEKNTQDTKEESQTILIKGEEENPTVRILIKSANYAGEYHQKVSICAEKGFILSYDGKEEEYKEEEILEIEKGTYETTGKIKIYPKEDGKICILNLERSQEKPMYRGSFEITRHPEGLRVINIVKMEEYLCGVVPSEMPASYPLEALKAQAVCARSYKKKIIENSQAEYDLDDSTSYQVYNNFPENENATKAVEETKGEIGRAHV